MLSKWENKQIQKLYKITLKFRHNAFSNNSDRHKILEYCLVSVVLGFEGTFNRDAQVSRLVIRQFGQFDCQSRQVSSCNLKIKKIIIEKKIEKIIFLSKLVVKQLPLRPIFCPTWKLQLWGISRGGTTSRFEPKLDWRKSSSSQKL